MQPILSLLNLFASSVSAAFAISAVIRPASLSGSSHITTGEGFYARMYAVRSIPLEMVAGLLPFWYRGPAVATIVFTSAVVQAADVVIGASKRDRGMITGASIATIIHLLCGYSVWRGTNQ
jgi:hypothetical protein